MMNMTPQGKPKIRSTFTLMTTKGTQFLVDEKDWYKLRKFLVHASPDGRPRTSGRRNKSDFTLKCVSRIVAGLPDGDKRRIAHLNGPRDCRRKSLALIVGRVRREGKMEGTSAA